MDETVYDARARAQHHYDIAWAQYAQHKKACRFCNPGGAFIAPKDDRCQQAQNLRRVVELRRQAARNWREGAWP